ncbi:LytTR family transcriptional regulator [Paenibacillus sp. MER TA 81-3]|uniref:LytTR family DNA-binding domain-containing protein n=1 Tax=Paenibacillus sp. MER TA 81-3 TaxID=2939573 RepID=UPI00203EEA2B|nr:LytTR family DNA-binding domain-containing protein [Paenibacillus sp. MER TA 81-3]MCM3342108.1 LytTR family transcriptional regulator [Paenibacillus sp. MER TA 81-3]
MKFEVSIEPSCKEPKIIILTDKITDEITDIMKLLSESSTDSLAVFSERGVIIVECRKIVRIYTERKKVFVQTPHGTYTVRSRLYELEEKLNSQLFVRISNSEIINIKMIINMDISITGTIGILLRGDIKTYASRRYVSKIKKLLLG